MILTVEVPSSQGKFREMSLIFISESIAEVYHLAHVGTQENVCELK